MSNGANVGNVRGSQSAVRNTVQDTLKNQDFQATPSATESIKNNSVNSPQSQAKVTEKDKTHQAEIRNLLQEVMGEGKNFPGKNVSVEV